MAYIKSLTFEQFTHLLMHINGIMRDIPMKEREIFEDVSMVPARGGLAAALAPMASSDMPLSRDKPMLLKYAFERIRELDDPRDIGLCLAMALTAIHVFGDGNGRTSRLVYDLMNYNYAGSKRDDNFLRTAMGDEGRFVTPDADPTHPLRGATFSLIIDEGYTKIDGVPYHYFDDGLQQDIDERIDINETRRQELGFLCNKHDNDRYAVFLAINRVLHGQNKLGNFARYFIPEHGIKSVALDRLRVIHGATDENIDAFYQEYWNIKADVVKKMTDLLVENRDLPDIKPLNHIPARDYAGREINNRMERNRSFGEDLADKWPEYPEETV